MNILLLSNKELSDAIEQTFGFLEKVGSSWKHHEPTLAHYKDLLEERSRRAGERIFEVSEHSRELTLENQC